MRTYFINTDAKSNKGQSLHLEWLRRGIAVTSGDSLYREALAKLAVGDRLLMYANELGIVALGYVTGTSILDERGGRRVNKNEPVEYQRQVTWSDLSEDPVSPQELEKLLFIPPAAVMPVAESNPRLDALLVVIKSRLPGGIAGGRFTPDRAIAVLMALRQSCQISDMPEKERSRQFHFGGGRARSLVVSRDMHDNWVRVYINRQSRKQDWFPIDAAPAHFAGVEVGFRYIRGYKGLNGQPGIASSVARISTLNPLDHHVLLLHCSDAEGFKKLARWYAGEFTIGSSSAPSSVETSGEGAWISVSAAPAAQSFGPPSASPTEPDAEPLQFSSSAETLNPDVPGLEGAGQGWMDDVQKRTAIEQYAVDIASAWYSSRGYAVQVLGKPYDLHCTRAVGADDPGDQMVHVEVKGSLGKAGTVRLTRNEVTHARSPNGWRNDLFVVSEIALERNADQSWIASGGQTMRFESWWPRDEDLVPTEFEYRLPL